MKFTYAYKTADGVRHEAAIEAPSREAAFESLRGQEIKPIKVLAADGSKANGENRDGLQRAAVVIAIGVAAVVGAVAFFFGERRQQIAAEASVTATAPRHQIYGDPAVIAEFDRGNFEGALTNKADQMLAWFAQPGRVACPRNVDPRRMAGQFAITLQSVGGKPGQVCLAAVTIESADVREVRELKQIVNGMREELQDYLSNGNGTPQSYWRRLVERSQQEMQIYERTTRELEKETNAAVWEEMNDALRGMGLRTIPDPTDVD